MYTPLTNPDFIRRIVADAIDRCVAHEGKGHLRPRWPDGSLEPSVTNALSQSLEHVMRSSIYNIPQFVLVTPEHRWLGDQVKFFDDVMDYAQRINAARRHIRDDGRLHVRPDIIVHERGERGPNYFVLELKMSTNRSRPQADFDRLKLGLMTDPNRSYRYCLGIELRAHRAVPEADRRIVTVSEWRNGHVIPP